MSQSLTSQIIGSHWEISKFALRVLLNQSGWSFINKIVVLFLLIKSAIAETGSFSINKLINTIVVLINILMK